VLEKYFRRFCLAKAQESQAIVEGEKMSEWLEARSFKTLSDGWPSFICHKLQELTLLMRAECSKEIFVLDILKLRMSWELSKR